MKALGLEVGLRTMGGRACRKLQRDGEKPDHMRS